VAGGVAVPAPAAAGVVGGVGVDAGEGELVLDLTALEGVDPTGLGVLVGAHRRAGRLGRTLVLRDTPPSVRRLLRRTRLDRVLRQTTTPSPVYI
jgi:anti-anti-sigma factor